MISDSHSQTQLLRLYIVSPPGAALQLVLRLKVRQVTHLVCHTHSRSLEVCYWQPSPPRYRPTLSRWPVFRLSTGTRRVLYFVSLLSHLLQYAEHSPGPGSSSTIERRNCLMRETNNNNVIFLIHPKQPKLKMHPTLPIDLIINKTIN